RAPRRPVGLSARADALPASLRRQRRSPVGGGGSSAIGQSAPRAVPVSVVRPLCVTKYSSAQTAQAKKKRQNFMGPSATWFRACGLEHSLCLTKQSSASPIKRLREILGCHFLDRLLKFRIGNQLLKLLFVGGPVHRQVHGFTQH